MYLKHYHYQINILIKIVSIYSKTYAQLLKLSEDEIRTLFSQTLSTIYSKWKNIYQSFWKLFQLLHISLNYTITHVSNVHMSERRKFSWHQRYWMFQRTYVCCGIIFLLTFFFHILQKRYHNLSFLFRILNGLNTSRAIL